MMAAISYIRAHAHRFGVDPTRLASFGSSAGATLAVYSAMKAEQGDPSARVRADVGWSGGYDFTVGPGGAIDPSQLTAVEQYLGCADPTAGSCQATEAAASATSLVSAGEPPTLVANSTDYQVGCEIVNPSQAEEMTADLEQAGDTAQLDLNGECAHAIGYGNVELAPTLTFLEAHLFVSPRLVSSASKTFTVGRAGSFTVKSKAEPVAQVSETGALPGGVTFVDQGNGDARLAGTPASGAAGSYRLVITASNGGVPDAVQHFTLTVRAPRH